MESVSAKLGVAIPWDDIAKEVEPHLTGEAIKQHLVKVYKFREEWNKKVPEKVDKTQRRKAARAAFGLVTPRKRGGGRGGKTAVDLEDEEGLEIMVQGHKAAPGTSLLWISDKDKKKKAAGEKETPVKTPGSGRGRKKPLKTENGKFTRVGKYSPSAALLLWEMRADLLSR